MSDEQPPAKDTVKFPPPPDWAIAMAQQIQDARKEQQVANETIQSDVAALKTSVARIADEQVTIVTRVATLEGWKEGTAPRLDQASMRAKGMSEVDMKHDANFATVFERLDQQDTAIADNTKKTDDIASDVIVVKKAVTGFFEDPKVRFVGKTIFLAAMAYAAAKGMKVLP